MHKERFHYLLEKYIKNQISDSELQEFLDNIAYYEADFLNAIDSLVTTEDNTAFDQDKVYQKIVAQKTHSRSKNFRRLIRGWRGVAAAAVMCCAIGVYYFTLERTSIPSENTQYAGVDSLIMLSENQEAILQLADGTSIDFNDSLAFGQSHDGVSLTKLPDGSIAMSFDKTYTSNKNKESHFHLFSTPKGSSFSMRLPDGTIAFLNSESKLHIPADFNQAGRYVKLTGEGYFEVAHNKLKPFVVQAKNTAVRVLGTHFNVRSYADEKQVETTLLEGSVLVNHSQHKIQLYPGEQAVALDASTLTKKEVSMQQVMAWKEGYFRFSNASIQDILKDIERWYVIKGVTYEFDPQERFTGAIKRSRSLTEVLDNIESISNMKFKISEGRIIVMK